MDDKNYINEIAEKIRQNFSSEELPEVGLDDLFKEYALLALAKGDKVTNEDVHNAWAAWATKYKPDSKSLVPYDQLSRKVQEEDSKFSVVIRNIGKSLNSPPF